jgi:hypothetical protein
MKIGSSDNAVYDAQNQLGIQNLYTQKLDSEQVKELRNQVEANMYAFTFQSFSAQSSALTIEDKFIQDYNEFQDFLDGIGYEGGSIASLSQDEAAKLVSEDGIFGIEQTSQRITNFVLAGADGNADLLRAGREGILRGFAQAEQMWGGELPEISQKTIEKTLEMVENAMREQYISVIDMEV